MPKSAGNLGELPDLYFISIIVALFFFILPFKSVLGISLQWGVLAFVVAVICIMAWHKAAGDSGGLANVAQGFAAVATVVAFAAAARIYFLESSDKVRLSVGLEAHVVRLTTRPGQQQRVLLSVRVPIVNRGAIQADIKCISIDVLQPEEENLRVRNQLAQEEMQLTSIHAPIRYGDNDSRTCIQREEAYFLPRRVRLHPLFMWSALKLQPGDERDRYFELPIRCGAPFVRVIVKVRIRPGDPDNHEVKTIVPLTDTCRGAEESSQGLSTPLSQAGDSVRSDTKAAPPP